MFSSMPLVILAAVTAASTSSNMLSVEGCEFGEVYSTTPASCDISFSNSGDIPVRIYDFSVVSGSGSATPLELKLAPHTTGSVRVRVDTAKTAGRASYIVVFNADPKSERRSAKVRGFVLSALDQAAPQIDLGVVDLALPPKTHVLTLGSHEIADFRITKVLSAPAWLSTTVDPDGKTVQVMVNGDAPWGLQEDYIRIAINTPRQKEALIKIKADIHGDVAPSENPVNIGVVRIGDHNEALVRLNSLSHKKLKLGEMKLEGFKGQIDSLPCIPKADDCAMVRVTVPDDVPAGSLRGTLWVDLPTYKKRLPVTTWGFLIPKNYVIPKVPLENEEQSKVAADKTDVAAALKNISRPKQAEAAPPPGTGPLLKWNVSDAATVYGFQIFRSDSESGPFVLLNSSPIRSLTEGNEGESYQWRDDEAKSGHTYFYSIGILRVNGKKEPLAGPQKVVAK